ncbi:MAG: hypothetical protein ABIL09_27930 [Gemmatimonadota bacterium]
MLTSPFATPFLILLGVAAIILASGASRAIQKRFDGSRAAGGALAALEERLAAVERRLGDIQEIVLSVDEKLERLELAPAAPPPRE